MKLKEIALEYRSRERLSKLGSASLSEAELLAVILQKGTTHENVIDMSHRLIATFGLERLKHLSLTELQTISGIGFAKACQIKAVFELNKRCSYTSSSFIIKEAKDVYTYASAKLKDLDREVFMIILLDTKNKVIKDEIVSVGTLNSCLLHPREVFKTAIKESCNALILVHNHPSGDPEPSEEDKKITEILFNAGEILNIKVLDHVVVGKEKWWSWAEK